MLAARVRKDLGDETAVNTKDIEGELDAITKLHGPFTAQNMQLAEGVFTLGPATNYDHFKLNRIKQVVADFGYLRSSTRLLDLASLQSMFAIEFALEDLNVVSIEGRLSNIEKGKFAAAKLGASSLRFFQEDVTRLDPEIHGRHDVVLCMGILYHIAKDKYADFLRRVASCCDDVLIIDSFVSLHDDEYLLVDGQEYRGTTWQEFEEGVSQAERDKAPHSSLTNNRSFSMTKTALIDYLATLGFTSIYEVLMPYQPKQPEDRPTLVCRRGTRQNLKVFPPFDFDKDFASAGDSRGIKGRNLVWWNLPRDSPKPKDGKSVPSQTAPISPDHKSEFGHRVANILRLFFRESTVRRIRRIVRGH